MMRSLRHPSVALALVGALFLSSQLAAQDCPGLPPLQPPQLEKCRGGLLGALSEAAGMGCAGRNQRKQFTYERTSRGFQTGLEYNSAKFFSSKIDDSATVVTVDSLRGCKGENINLELTPGNVTFFEYQLDAPSGVTVARGSYRNWRGDKILGDNLTLTETGYYVLKTRTTAPAKTDSYKNKDGTVEYRTTYPRAYRVGFRTDVNAAPLSAGDKVNATINTQQPFLRKVLVKGGTKVRFRFASQGTGDFLVVVRRETGEELYRNAAPTSFYETRAFTPKTDERFGVEVRPWLDRQSVGVEFSVVDDKATGEAVTSSSRVVSAFKLPAHFDAKTSAPVATSETSRLIFTATKPEDLNITVRPSQLAGLKMRVRVYNTETEELALKPVVVAESVTLPVSLPQAGTWIIELMPVAATDMDEAGEAKYTIEFAPRAR